MDYTMSELLEWNERIERIAKDIGLNYYEQEFEICDFDDMIGYETYIGMPSHYPHWSFGKSFERTKMMRKLNLTGLPYEMVINSNPCLAYLMKDNTLLLQILTIAHVYGHNDFFKNNRLFTVATDADNTLSMFKLHADRIRSYIADPSIGYNKVEKMLDAAHALKYQVARGIGVKKLTPKEKRQGIANQINKLNEPGDYPLLTNRKSLEDQMKISKLQTALAKAPPEPEEDILGFIIDYVRLEEWQKDIIQIVRQETTYFMPQIETKVMNEGWASYHHYKILNELHLPSELHMEFLQRHNQVIRPHRGQINPYYIGFKIFEWLDKNGADIFKIRQLDRDASFIRLYLNRELCEEMNLFEYTKESTKTKTRYKVSEVSDEEGWKEVRDTLAEQVGLSFIPNINIVDYKPTDNALYMDCTATDDKELELEYAKETIKYVVDLVGIRTVLFATIDGKEVMIVCDTNRNVTVT